MLSFQLVRFLSDHVNSEEQTFLVNAGLLLLQQHGIVVRAITMDGSHPNQRTAKLLGAKLDFKDFRPSFPHPST